MRADTQPRPDVDPAPPTRRTTQAPTVQRGWRAGLTEIVLLAAVYVAYSGARLLADDHLGPAVERARGLLRVERALGIDVEVSVNHAVLGRSWLSIPASYWYASAHYVVTAVVLVLLYRLRPAAYRPLRRALVLATAAALVLYVLLPTAPPRLTGSPYVDVLARTSDHGWWGGDASAPRGLGDLTNQLAAFPSMHAGWALWVALAALTVPARRWVRVLAAAYALVTAFVVVGTANHWTIDVLAGWALVGAACAVCVLPERSSVGAHPDPDPAPPSTP